MWKLKRKIQSNAVVYLCRNVIASVVLHCYLKFFGVFKVPDSNIASRFTYETYLQRRCHHLTHQHRQLKLPGLFILVNEKLKMRNYYLLVISLDKTFEIILPCFANILIMPTFLSNKKLYIITHWKCSVFYEWEAFAEIVIIILTLQMRTLDRTGQIQFQLFFDYKIFWRKK